MDKEQLKNILTNKNNRFLYIILIIGIILLTLSGNLQSKHQNTTLHTTDTDQIATVYEDTQKDLEQILSCVCGINKVKVMITYESSEENMLAYDTSFDISKNKDEEKEESVTKEDKKILTASGEPYIVKKTYPKVRGVIVVATGADNPIIKQNIIDSVKAVLDIADHKICVLNYK